MFSYERGVSASTLIQSKDYWLFQNGARIIEFLTTLDRVTPSPDCEQQVLSGSHIGHCPQDRFMDDGNELLFEFDFMRENGPLRERLSHEIPYEYAAAFVTSVFRPEYENCNFLQALTAMDYLTGIEINRKRKLHEAAIKLGITKDTWSSVLAGEVDAWHWVQKIQEEEFIVDGYYAKIFINLRIWILVAELQQPKFDKMNVFALLNTLFPPCIKQICSDKVTPQVMYRYRAALYRQVLDVGKDGPRALDPFISRHLRPGTGCSWHDTRYQLEKYLELALSMTRHSQQIYGIHSFHPAPTEHSTTSSSRTTSMSSGRIRANSSAHASFDSALSPSDVPTTPGSTIYDGASARSQLRRLPRIKAESGHNEHLACDPQSNISAFPYPPSVSTPRETRSRRKPSGTRFPVRVSKDPETVSSITLTQYNYHDHTECYDNGDSNPVSGSICLEVTQSAIMETTPDLGRSHPKTKDMACDKGSLGKESLTSDIPGVGLSPESRNLLANRKRTGTGTRFPVAVPPIKTALYNTVRHRKYSDTTSSESPGSSALKMPSDVTARMDAIVPTVLDGCIPTYLSNRERVDQTFQRTQSGPNEDGDETAYRISANPVQAQVSGETRLPSDNMEFLQRPYDSASVTRAEPVVKKKANITNLYLRGSAAVSTLKKKASSNSLKPISSLPSPLNEPQMSSESTPYQKKSSVTSHEYGNVISHTRKLSRPEPFPRFSSEGSQTFSPIAYSQNSFNGQDKDTETPSETLIGTSAPAIVSEHSFNTSEKTPLDMPLIEAAPKEQQVSKKRPILRKAKSFVTQKSLMGKDTEVYEKFPDLELIRAPSHTTTSPSSTLTSKDINRKLKPKASLSSLFARSQNSESRPFKQPAAYSVGNESQESILTARPKIRTAKSFSSLRANKLQKTLIKNSVLTSGQRTKDLSHTKDDMNRINSTAPKRTFNPPDIFSMLGIYQHSLDFHQKEYSRRWLIEDSKSRRNPDLNPPVGRPFEFVEVARAGNTKGAATETRGSEEVGGVVLKAAKKPLTRPEIFRVDSIFPSRTTPK